MAYISQTTPRDTSGAVSHLMTIVRNAITAVAEAKAKRDQLMALSQLPDAELKRQGLSRDTLVRHVFAQNN